MSGAVRGRRRGGDEREHLRTVSIYERRANPLDRGELVERGRPEGRNGLERAVVGDREGGLAVGHLEAPCLERAEQALVDRAGRLRRLSRTPARGRRERGRVRQADRVRIADVAAAAERRPGARVAEVIEERSAPTGL